MQLFLITLMTKTDIYGTQNTVVRVATLRTKNGILDVAFSIDIPNPPNLLASEKPEVSAQGLFQDGFNVCRPVDQGLFI